MFFEKAVSMKQKHEQNLSKRAKLHALFQTKLAVANIRYS